MTHMGSGHLASVVIRCVFILTSRKKVVSQRLISLVSSIFLPPLLYLFFYCPFFPFPNLINVSLLLFAFAFCCQLQQEKKGTSCTKDGSGLLSNRTSIHNTLWLTKAEPFPSRCTFPFRHSMLPVCSLPHWPSEPHVRPERGLFDLQLCLLSTQTSVRTAGRTREGQTVESIRWAAHAHPKTHTHTKCALEHTS